MSASIADIEAVLNQIRMDLTNAQAKLTEAKRMVGALPLERERPKWNCELCVGGLGFATEEKLRDHVALVHQEPRRRVEEARRQLRELSGG